ncbi:MAG: PmoA family protein [Planctomycetaceae bacterium]
MKFLAAGIAWSLLAAGVDAEQRLRFVVQTGDHPRHDCPLKVALPPQVSQFSHDWRLWDVSTDRPTPVSCQFLNSDHSVLAWILSGAVPPRTIRQFEFRPSRVDDPPILPPPVAPVEVVSRDESWDVRIGEKPVLRYHGGRSAPPEGIDPRFARSGYIHPVWTPDGQVVTDEFPPDHAHQSGIFLAYVKTEFEGRTPDFWNLLANSGFVRTANIVSLSTGVVCGGLRVAHEHVDNGVSGGKVALRETWDLRVWQSSGTNGWRFDITSVQECASSAPLLLKEYHYGGMAYRGARAWTGDQAVFTTAKGSDRETGNHERGAWVDLSGKSDQQWSGLTSFTDPANFRFPEPVRLHPKMPYLVWTPSVLGDWAITPGRPHVSRYHFHVHDGQLSREQAERIWAEISDPPQIAVSIITE